MPTRFRKVLFAIFPLLLIFGSVEGTLYFLNYQGTSIADIQLTAGFQQNAYVHRRDRILGDWFIEKDGLLTSNPYLLARGFHQQSFPPKPNGKRRYFALGGSTTYGSPFEHQRKGFPELLEESLNDESSDQWEIINVGVAGMDSISFPELLKELVQYQPEGIIIYAGNNEIRGALTERCGNPYRVGIEQQINRVRTVQLLRDQFRRFQNITVHFDQLAERQDDCMKREVEKIQKEKQSLLYKELVQERFYQNLQTTINTATENNISVFLAIPPINLLLPPADQHWDRGLPRTEESALQTLLKAQPVIWEKVLTIDPSFSLASYKYGMQLYSQGQIENAKFHLSRAVSQDHFSQRITPELQQTLQTLCKINTQIQCVDINQAFLEEMNGKIPDSNLFEDFCHPTFERGTSLIATQFVLAID